MLITTPLSYLITIVTDYWAKATHFVSEELNWGEQKLVNMQNSPIPPACGHPTLHREKKEHQLFCKSICLKVCSECFQWSSCTGHGNKGKGKVDGW
jgi:hypothetical protein